MMGKRFRVLLAVAVLLGVALVAVRLEMANDDWRRCFHSEATMSPRPAPKVWPSVVGLLKDPETVKGILLLLMAPVVPTLLVIALARGSLLPLLTVAPLALLIVSVALTDAAALHHCDRKGSGGEGVVLLLFLIQLPLSVLVLIGLGARRLIGVTAAGVS